MFPDKAAGVIIVITGSMQMQTNGVIKHTNWHEGNSEEEYSSD